MSFQMHTFHILGFNQMYKHEYNNYAKGIALKTKQNDSSFEQCRSCSVVFPWTRSSIIQMTQPSLTGRDVKGDPDTFRQTKDSSFTQLFLRCPFHQQVHNICIIFLFFIGATVDKMTYLRFCYLAGILLVLSQLSLCQKNSVSLIFLLLV